MSPLVLVPSPGELCECHRFVDLVEREWLNGGYQFSLRHHPVASAPEREKAPIFLLFLDAVWQVRTTYSRDTCNYCMITSR